MKNNKQKKHKKQQHTIVESLETKIAKAVFAEKKISERIIGYYPYQFEFVKATYFGTTKRPAKISAIEKGIVGILLIDGYASFERIGRLLGLDVVNDKAERTILSKALNGLRSFKAIEGDDDYITLTEAGKVYADKGERPDTYQKTFDIFIDKDHVEWKSVKNALSAVIEHITIINTKIEDMQLSIDDVRQYAAIQAQDVHYPQERYLLESALWKEGHKGTYKMYICFVQGVSTGIVRAFAFDENTNKLNPIVAEYINSDSTLASQLLEQCIKLECEMNFDTQIIDEESVEEAKANVSQEILDAEKRLVDEESEQVQEDKEHEILEVETPSSLSVNKASKKTKSSVVPAKERLHKKALYDSMSFEVELQKIFKEDNPDEIWLMSPWIRKSAFMNDRGPLIENFLADENKRIFIAYSEPAQTKNDEKPMMDEEVEPGIKMLADQYPNFFYVQLPEFHFKNVIEVKGDQKILFSGSFNVLSFSVSEHQTHIRREEMALANPSIAKSKYVSFQVEFAEKYAERIKKEIESLSLDDIDTYENERMEYFLGIDNPEIKKIYLPLVELLEEKKYQAILVTIRKRLTSIGQQFVVLANTTGITGRKKMDFKKELESIEKDMAKHSVDDPSLAELLSNNLQLLEKMKEQKIFPGRKNEYKHNNTPQHPNTVRTIVSTHNNDILNEVPFATKKELSLYLARLSQAFMLQEIKKGLLNAKLVSIIENSDLFALLDMLTVQPSKRKEEAFDLCLGVNGYMFWYSTLFNSKDVFTAVQKRTQQRLIVVNQNNIQTVITQLS